MSNDFEKGLCIGLVSGAVIGGVIALLYAAKTGKETRQIIKDKTIEAVDAVKEKASEASRKGQAAIQALKS